MSTRPTIVFAGSPNFNYMQEQICDNTRFVASVFNQGKHPNGEIWNRMPEEAFKQARRRNVLIIGGTDPEDFTSLLHCVSIASRVAAEVYILIPFFRYATHERRDSPGDVVAAKEICDRLSRCAVNGVRTTVLFFDLHAEGMEFYCDPTRIITEHIRSHDLWVEYIRERTGHGLLFGPDIAIGSADFGRKNQVIKLAEDCGCPYGLVAKERVSASETHTLGTVHGDVKGRAVILFDDMLRGGSTSIDGAKAHLRAGAKKVWVLVTHPDFAGDPLKKLSDSGLIEGVITGDTYPQHTLAEKYPNFAFTIKTGKYLSDAVAKSIAVEDGE